MELIHENRILLPANCALLTEEEMVYVDGGAITAQDVATFAGNFVRNALYMIGSIGFSVGLGFVSSSIQGAGSFAGGMSAVGAAIGALNSAQLATLAGLGVLASFYFVGQVIQMIGLVQVIASAAVQFYQQITQQTPQQPQQPGLVVA